jgi:hypothetical protein
VRSFCRAEDPATLPLKKTRTPLIRLIENHLFAISDGKVLLEQSTHRWRGMWILPRLNLRSNRERPIHSAQFPFTHHQITLQVFADHPPKRPTAAQRYFTRDEIDTIPVPSPHRRALTQLLADEHLNSSTSRRMTRKVQPCVR